MRNELFVKARSWRGVLLGKKLWLPMNVLLQATAVIGKPDWAAPLPGSGWETTGQRFLIWTPCLQLTPMWQKLGTAAHFVGTPSRIMRTRFLTVIMCYCFSPAMTKHSTSVVSA